jgi:hypothetical protein
MPKLKLFEAKPREFMSDLEKKLKRKLVNLLRDDGKGHHHAKYADRLELFDIQIVPLKVDPGFTAAISFDRGIIMIGEGFLTDPETFYQLNVLMRHELAHNLLMHQIRMAYKLGEPVYNHTSLSGTLHRLQNIIADDEISNRKYSEEDKSIVRNMILNGKEIGGLVTEDHRKDWINMSIEEMYDQLCEEIAVIHKKLKAKKEEIAGKRGKLSKAINNHIYYGVHQEGDFIYFREWAPNAKEIYVIGDFNGWSKDIEFRMSKLANGNWELKVAPERIRHKDLFKFLVIWEGGEGERLPAYATRCVQNPATKDFAAQIWFPENPYKWEHKRAPKVENPLIYEVHIGMSSEEYEVASFKSFTENVLPRIAD